MKMKPMTCSPNFDPRPESYDDPSGRAERIIRFCESLSLWEGKHAGKPFLLHDWQKAIVRRIYGPCKPDGSRLTRTACLWLPRGQGKTALVAALALAHLLGPENEEGGQIIVAAADRENASIAFNHALKMCQAQERLSSRVRPVESQKKLIHPKSNSILKAISSEAYSKHGMNATFFLTDEVHSWSPVEARQLWGVIGDSMVKRENPLTISISTAGSGTSGLAWDLWNYSHDVALGKIDDKTFAPIIFAADPKAKWDDETTWLSCNPAAESGFLSLVELRLKAKRCAFIPTEKSDFLRFHLNVWHEGSALPWIDDSVLDDAAPMSDDEELRGSRCFVGIDLSASQDTTAVAAVFPDGAGGYDCKIMAFLPEENLQAKSDRDRANYAKWARDGFLRLTPGNVIDHAEIIAYVQELAEEYNISEIVLDRWGAVGVTTKFQELGFNVAEFGQGFASMAAPVAEFERALLSKRFRFGGNPVLRSAIQQVAIEKDAAGNCKFTKSKSRGRIDAAVATVMAIGRASAGNSSGSNPYEERGFLFL